VDETRVGELTVRVSHRIQRLGTGSTRVTYSVEAEGPDAAEIGAAVSNRSRGTQHSPHALSIGRRNSHARNSSGGDPR